MLRRSIAAFAFSALAIAACNGNQTMNEAGGSDASDVGPDIVDHVVINDAGDVPMDVPMESSTTCGSGYGPCNPVTNAGCPTGQACFVASDGDGGVTTVCSMPGTAGWGQHCASADGCMQGFACLGSMCLRLCCGPGDNATCRSSPGGMNGALCNQPLAGVSFYGCQAVTNCDWFQQNCPGGGSCEPTDTAGDTACNPAGTGRAGAQCAGSSTSVNCAPGYTCILDMGSMTNAHCRQVCDPTVGPTDDAGTTPDGGVSRRCPTGTMCNPVGMRPMNYGVCI
jgi:hypothetical protein